MKAITRRRALELAQVGLAQMVDAKGKTLAMAKQKYTPEGAALVENEYAELVAALDWIERQSRQQDLGL